jgi:hypothetical protein
MQEGKAATSIVDDLATAQAMFDRMAHNSGYDIKIRRAALEASGKIDKILGWIRAAVRAQAKQDLAKKK